MSEDNSEETRAEETGNYFNILEDIFRNGLTDEEIEQLKQDATTTDSPFDAMARATVDEDEVAASLGRTAIVLASTTGMTPIWVLEHLIMEPMYAAIDRQHVRLAEAAARWIAEEIDGWTK